MATVVTKPVNAVSKPTANRAPLTGKVTNKPVMTLTDAGFYRSKSEPTMRLVISSQAQEKCGKTHFALGAPGPIAYINWDDGEEGVIHKFDRNKEVYLAEVERLPRKLTVEQAKEQYRQIWDDAKRKIESATENPDIRTIVIDTLTEGWEYCRMAHFGKLTQVMPHQYAAPKSEMRDLIRYMIKTSKNLIFINKVKKAYKEGSDGKSNWNGKYEIATFDELPFLAQVNIEHYRKSVEGEGVVFGFRVLNSRLEAAAINGVEFEGEDCSFMSLALNAWPESKEEDWL